MGLIYLYINTQHGRVLKRILLFFRAIFISNVEIEFQTYQPETDSTSVEAFGDIRN
jgi:hypothetical protein